MALLHTMSLAGSVAVGIYLVSYFLTKRYLPVLWHKIYLTISIFLFFMPVADVKRCYGSFMNRYPVLREWVYHPHKGQKISDYIIYAYPDGISIPNLSKYIILLATVLIGICGLILFIKKYNAIYRTIAKNTVQFDKGERTLKELEKGHKRRVKSKVYLCPKVKAPITIGTIRRKIVLPDVAWEEDRLKDALHHELTHVRAMDNFFKMALLLVVILNFYNPFAYYLWYRWNLVAELYCDYKVAKNKSIQETGRYANLIIDFAQKQEATGLPIVGLSIGEKQLKERIEHLKNLKKAPSNYGKMRNAAGVFVIILAVFASSLTALAYDKTQIHFFDEPYEEVIDGYFFENHTWKEVTLTEDDKRYNAYDNYIHADSESFFVSESGAVSYKGCLVTEKGDNDESCDHIWATGTVLKHQKDGSGKCSTEFYNGKQCTACKGIVCEKYIFTSAFDKCPH